MPSYSLNGQIDGDIVAAGLPARHIVGCFRGTLTATTGPSGRTGSSHVNGAISGAFTPTGAPAAAISGDFVGDYTPATPSRSPAPSPSPAHSPSPTPAPRRGNVPLFAIGAGVVSLFIFFIVWGLMKKSPEEEAQHATAQQAVVDSTRNASPPVPPATAVVPVPFAVNVDSLRIVAAQHDSLVAVQAIIGHDMDVAVDGAGQAVDAITRKK